MAQQEGNNLKLGVFVLAGLIALILCFYMIGKNTNMFGSSFELKARFSNLNGLMEGNNVLFAGIQAGTVKSIKMVNDTTIEVTMVIDSKIKPYIHTNAVATIGTEGLMGNEVVNIQTARGFSPSVRDQDMLATQQLVSPDELLQTLSKTNKNVLAISKALKATVLRLDTSAILNILNDKNIGVSITSSLKNINNASENASEMTYGMNQIVNQIKRGKGAAGFLLTDTVFTGNLKAAVVKINSASDNANKATVKLNNMVGNVNNDLIYGKGPLHALLQDSAITEKLNASMDNVQKGTDGFNQVVQALKHNFLVRGYFKRQAKEDAKMKEKEAKNISANK